ncbi:endolytic transglycosylase MltG [Neptuniibacter halophilus]|uniref:endolytic transglycosylase MltG n=1 Tax=Neptuniibacter halophilus TaxID=651666 RepID=UPI00257389B1|nr:endolytic transglycosylase MltG [Neptuniibacter halophilus]
MVWHDYQNYLAEPLDITGADVFEVRKGANYRQVIDDLEAITVGLNRYYMRFYGRHSGLAEQIKAGEYALAVGLTPRSFLQLVTSGRSINYSFTIIEGSNLKSLLESLAAAPHIEDDISALSVEALSDKLGLEHKHPEGLFLAETYSYEKNTPASVLLKRANNHLVTALDETWQKRAEKLPYKNAYEALIMASIVEKETARADERPVIAGVFVRRLNKKMRLQTDPTVIYGMGDDYKGNIRRSDLRKPTPYNTYVIPALPPTPIAMVGREAIEAALHPADGKALFFVAKGDGSHYFSATLKEHNAAVRRYQLSRRKDYRSSP